MALSDAIRSMRTGDVLLFRPRVGGLRTWLLGYTHVGMIVGDSNVVEAHDAGDVTELGNRGGGVYAYNVAARVNAYDGDVYWSRLSSPPPSGTIESIVSTYQNHGYDDDHVSWLMGTCVLGLPLPRRPNVVFCSELVTRVLQRAGVLSADIDPSCMTPDHVADLDVYEPPVRLT